MTTRALSPTNAAAALASTTRPGILFEAEFASGWLRVWSGIGDLVWNSVTWSGVGDLLSVSAIGESDEIVSRGVTVSLVANPPNIAAVLAAARQGKPGRVYLGFFSAAGALLDAPVLLFEGRLDVPEIQREPDRCVISVTYEDELVDLERPRIRRYTREDQALDDPTDMGFEFITALQDAAIVWGKG